MRPHARSGTYVPPPLGVKLGSLPDNTRSGWPGVNARGGPEQRPSGLPSESGTARCSACLLPLQPVSLPSSTRCCKEEERWVPS